MKDEIKEILDKLKDDAWYDELDLTGDKWIELKQTETRQILDYITNLQQKIEKLENDKRGMLVQLYKANVEKDKLKQEKFKLQARSDRYKSKCENAIERIKALIIFWKKYSPDNTMEIGQFEGLLDILNGSDKDCTD